MRDAEAYVARAVQLATQPDVLNAVRQRVLAARHHAPLFDSPRWVRNHERALELMHTTMLHYERMHHIVVRDAAAA